MSVSIDDRDARRSAMLAEAMESGAYLPMSSDLLTLRSAVPPTWREACTISLDGTVRIDASGFSPDALPALPALPVRSAPALLGELAAALGGVGELEPEACLDSIEAGHVLGARIERARMHTAGELAARAGMELLRQRGTDDPGELSRTARERWRAQSKSIATLEIQTLTGISRWEARELVAIALAPTAVTSSIRQALQVGLARWGEVVKFWRRCGRLPHEQAAVVARALFATDAPAEELAVERLDPDGVPHEDPWPAKVFAEALEREATRIESTDPESIAARRAAQREARTAYGVVDDDGTGQVVITGDAASTSACVDRLHILAKKARAAGDQRTESQLRSDIGRALILHGTLPLPGPPADPPDDARALAETGQALPGLDDEEAVLTPDELTSLATILSGMPTYEMQVIVPWDVLTGQPVVPASEGPVSEVSSSGVPASGVPASGVLASEVPSSDALAPDAPAPGRSGRASPGQLHPAQRTEGVGRLLGRFTRSLTAHDLRAMALEPGSRFVRLLTDPADGRCTERTLERYEPDDRMRQQIHAADVTSRGPGSTTPASACQLDHVLEHRRGGRTAEPNFQSLDDVWHGGKTAKFWKAAIDETRNVTWTSFFGRVYRTRGHDYRQYLATGLPLATTPGQGHAAEEQHPRLPIEDQRHLASLMVYAALAERQQQGRLQAYDDDPLSDDELVSDTHTVIWVRHTRRRDGRKVSGRRADTPTPEEIVSTPAREILDAAHWTDPFTGRAAQAPEGVKGEGSAREAWGAQDADEQPPPF